MIRVSQRAAVPYWKGNKSRASRSAMSPPTSRRVNNSTVGVTHSNSVAARFVQLSIAKHFSLLPTPTSYRKMQIAPRWTTERPRYCALHTGYPANDGSMFIQIGGTCQLQNVFNKDANCHSKPLPPKDTERSHICGFRLKRPGSSPSRDLPVSYPLTAAVSIVHLFISTFDAVGTRAGPRGGPVVLSSTR